MLRVNEAVVRLFNYCIGWVVTDDPPAEELRELEALGFATGSPRVARVNWLRYLKLSGEQEAAELVGHIMALVFQDEVEKNVAQPENVDTLKARIAELEAKEIGS